MHVRRLMNPAMWYSGTKVSSKVEFAENRHISDHTESKVLSCGDVRRRIAFFSFLLEKGADPNIVIQCDTAMDILTTRIDGLSKSAKIYLLALAATWRGETLEDMWMVT